MLQDLRQDSRFELRLDVMLHYRPLGLLRARTRNVSLEGMFVEMGQIMLPKNVDVEITFSLPGTGRLQPHQLHARVVHSGRDGAGLAFLNYNLSTLRALRGVLKAA